MRNRVCLKISKSQILKFLLKCQKTTFTATLVTPEKQNRAEKYTYKKLKKRRDKRQKCLLLKNKSEIISTEHNLAIKCLNRNLSIKL